MKTIIKAFIATIVVVTAQAQDQTGVARVNRIDGVEVYFMNEPLRDYDVVFDVGTGAKAASLLTGGLVNEGVSAKASQFVKKAIKEAKDDGHQFDAIIYSSGKRIVAVKFKEGGEENKLLARAQKINGIEVYVLSEPLRNYEVVNTKGSGVKMKSAFTAGLVNNSIDEDVEQFVKKLVKDAEKDKVKLDAVVYSSGKSASGVKFTN